MSETPISSDDEYESSQCSTPSRSRENSVSSPIPLGAEGGEYPTEIDANEIQMRKDSFSAQPSDEISTELVLVNKAVESTASIPTQLLHTPDKPHGGEAKADIVNAVPQEVTLKNLSEIEEEPLYNKTPQPPPTPRPLGIRTPLRSPTTHFQPKTIASAASESEYKRSDTETEPIITIIDETGSATLESGKNPSLDTPQSLPTHQSSLLEHKPNTLLSLISAPTWCDEAPKGGCKKVRNNQEDDTESTMQGVLITNLSHQVTEDDVTKLLGLKSSDYLNHFCSCKIATNNTVGKFAFITAPTHVAAEILKLNGIQYYSKTIEIKAVPLQFLEMMFQDEGKAKDMSADDILDFLFDDEDDKALSRCDVLGAKLTGKSNGVAIIATALLIDDSDKLGSTDMSPTNSDHYYSMLNKLFVPKTKIATQSITKKGKPLTTKACVNQASVEQLVTEIRSYEMNICKQMKRKLNYLSRPNFQVKYDRGSAKKEQVYIECSTANYEYLRRYLVMILVDVFSCEEDVKKRRVRCDKDQKSEVEAQYSIHFSFDQIKYTISITLYYTKCSLWIQGPPTQIDGMALAQFFVVNYLEKVSKMIERNVSLESVGDALRLRITSFMTDEEARDLINKTVEIDSEHCVSCSRKCANNNKSIRCTNCQGKQHFKCASVNDESQRQMYLTGGEVFICNRCFSEVDISLFNSSSSQEVVQGKITAGTEYDEVSSVPIPSGETDNNLASNTVLITEAEYDETPISQQMADDRDIAMNLTTQVSNSGLILDHTSQQQNNGIKEGHDTIMIRRLQAEITKLKTEHVESKRKMEIELGELREAYRQSCANYERERETKNALQQCIETLQKQGNNTRNVNNLSQPSSLPQRDDVQQGGIQNYSQVRMRAQPSLHSNSQQLSAHQGGQQQTPNQQYHQYQQEPQQPAKLLQPHHLHNNQMNPGVQQQQPGQRSHQHPPLQNSYQQQPGPQQKTQQNIPHPLFQQQQQQQAQNNCQQPTQQGRYQQQRQASEYQHQQQQQTLPRCHFYSTRKGCQRNSCKFPHIEGPPNCRFFNSKKGCQRSNCSFPHVQAPPCRYRQDCRRRRCRFNHGYQDIQTGAPTSNFLGQNYSPNQPPDLTRSREHTRQERHQPSVSSYPPLNLNCSPHLSSAQNLVPTLAQTLTQGNRINMNNPIPMSPAHYQNFYPAMSTYSNNSKWTPPQNNIVHQQY